MRPLGRLARLTERFEYDLRPSKSIYTHPKSISNIKTTTFGTFLVSVFIADIHYVKSVRIRSLYSVRMRQNTENARNLLVS